MERAPKLLSIFAQRCHPNHPHFDNIKTDNGQFFSSSDVYYRTKVPTTAKPSIRWQQLMHTKKLQITSSFQWVLSRLHRTKNTRDNPPCIVQALPPALKMVCSTACRAQCSTFWQVEIFIWTAFSCWIQIVHPFYRSATNKWATARFHVDSAIAAVGKTESP